MPKNELVVKDNALINASYNLDTVEQRLILLAILQARETKTELMQIHDYVSMLVITWIDLMSVNMQLIKH